MATVHSDKRFHQLTLAIQKAINSIETPVKEKHVRSTIIGTFQEQSAITYWMVAIRLPLQDNRIVAWKFCHVTHKLLREGHPACLDDSQRHINMIENLGKLWVHLREGYGRLVNLYCNLLVCKLKFHSRNPQFPGNMQLTADELDAIAENDVNNYFQLCVELFDYMEDILILQAAVFDSLGNARANSMTASGQCRLAALIPCAQDSSQIYDCNVRLLFRLHAALPADTLAGHRERFRQQFKKLSSFYKHASSLQYYRNLLTLPLLPSNPPNFLIQSDFGTYVTPVVSVPEPPPDEVDAVGSLVDTSDIISQSTTPEQLEVFDARTTPSPQPDPVVERDRLIDHLQHELKRLRSEVTQLLQERHTMVDSMREHCTRLETQLQMTKTELDEEKHRAELLSVETPEIKQKLTATEEKAKVTDEKFQKLKGAYTQLREEHITLIRQKAEVDKTAAVLRASAAQHESAKMTLQQQLNDRIKDVELLQQSASSSEEIDAYKTELSSLRTDLEQSRQKEVELETIKASMEALEIEYKTSTKEQQEKLTTVANELKDMTENLETIKREKEEREIELSRIKEELEGVRAKSGDEFKKILEEKQAALVQVAELTKQYQQEKQEQSLYIKDLQDELENLQQTLTNKENNFKSQLTEVSEDLKTKNRELSDILNAKDAEIKEALKKITVFESELKETGTNYEKKSKEINTLQERINELLNLKETDVALLNRLEEKNNSIQQDLNQVTEEKIKLRDVLTAKETELIKLSDKFKEQSDTMNMNYEQLENSKNLEILSFKETLQKTIVENESKITELQKGYKYETSLLKDKLQNAIESKEEVIHNMKDMIKEKDAQVISLNLELNKLSDEGLRLEDELKETHAELEIGRNELLALRDEHEAIIERRDTNLAMKNDELRKLHEEVNKLTEENDDLKSQKDNVSKLLADLATEKQILESDLKKSIEEHKHLRASQEEHQLALEEVINNLNNEILILKAQNEKLETSNSNEIRILNEKITTQESAHIVEITEKDEFISKMKGDCVNFETKLHEVESLRTKEKEDVEFILSEKDKEKQMLEVRLDHTERERLNAECELQDLLQHNTVLEADLAVLRKQLEDAQLEIEKQRTRVVECAGEAAVEVTSGALAAVERANAHDTSRAAAELATKALHQLNRHTETKGNEETLARSAIFAAHSTAQLAAFAAEMSNTSTNMELSDKMNNECRTMLQATKQCLESLRSGVIDGSSYETARASVDNVARSAAAAERLAGGERSVDDELADMDLAIEQAASQIEELLAASRAGDSGVKLEVNEKILDACTTLMAAVKILVQDARKLQNELGDPKTRQKMYRKNPQWSEGLISAAKAVVFAAKLLVSSADEAVGAAGRVEGVSAAAHEVAGSTAQLVAASRARAPPQAPALARLTQASRAVAAATGAVVAAVRAASARVHEQEALDTSALTLTATRRLEMESKVRSLELECALDAERARLAALRKRHYHLAQLEENGNMTNGKE